MTARLRMPGTLDPGRVEFIVSTVGAEVKRACDYLQDHRLHEEFVGFIGEHEHEIRRIDLIWWAPGEEVCIGSSYKLSPPGVRNVLAGPGCKTGIYIADGQLPAEPGWELEIVAHTSDLSTEFFVESTHHLTKRQRQALAHDAMGSRVLR